MRFSHPEILYALAAVLIPVIIHLFNFRRYKKILFSNIDLLKNISIETKKQNRLKHLLILLARMLTLAFAVLAFAGPYFPSVATQENNRGVLFIAVDNSYSMEAAGESGRLLDEAKKEAVRLVKRSPKNTRFSLLSGNPDFGYHLLNRSEALLKLEKLTAGNHHTPLSTLVRQMNRIARKNSAGHYTAFLFSDFQTNQTDIEQTVFDTASFYYFLPFRHNVLHNLYIDSCRFEQPNLLPGKHVVLTARIVNASAEPVEKLGVKLYIDNKQKALAATDIAAGDFSEVKFGFTVRQKGWHRGKVKIEDYPITFDDNLLFSFFVRNKIKVLEIDPEEEQVNPFIKTFYASDSLFVFTHTGYRQLNRFRPGDYDIIILNGVPQLSNGLQDMLKQYVQNGGNLTLIPPREDAAALNPLLTSLNAGKYGAVDTASGRTATLNGLFPFFKRAISNIPANADYPLVFKHYGYSYNLRSNLQPLAVLLNGDPLVLTKPAGSGHLFVFTVPLNKQWSTLPENPLFTVLFFGMATENGTQQKPYYFIGKENRIVINNNLPVNPDEVLTVTGENGDFIPMQRRMNERLVIDLQNNISKEGFYLLKDNDSVYKQLAFNTNRDESQMHFYGKKELDSLLNKAALPRYRIADNPSALVKEIINTPDKRTQLWKLFIIFALFMMLTEILIIRFWK